MSWTNSDKTGCSEYFLFYLELQSYLRLLYVEKNVGIIMLKTTGKGQRLHVWPSGLKGRHTASYFTKCCRYKSYMGQLTCVCDLKTVVLSLGFRCVHFLYVCKFLYDTGYISYTRIVFLKRKKKRYQSLYFCLAKICNVIL